MQQRRKSPFAAAPAAAKQEEAAPARRPGARLSLAGLLVSIFLVAAFLYHEDSVVKPQPLAIAGAERARSSPDLRLLQEAALPHHEAAVNSHSHSQPQQDDEEQHHRVDADAQPGKKKKKEPAANKQQQAEPAVLLDAPPKPSGNISGRAAVEVPWAPEPAACDLYRGWWTYDAEGEQAPLYHESECEFLTEQVTCMRNGRRDDSYQRWRWQPSSCDLPRFDARALLERLRGKRLMFVGDSLNRNQWESMVCLVQSAVSPDKKYVTWEDQRVVFHAWEFNATVEFYWAPFLVESNSDDPKIHSIQHRIIDAESIAAHAENWRSADYLVFNTYIWWMNTLNMKLKRPGGENWEDHDELVRIEAYRKVLNTWASWVDENIDPARTSVFFMSMSPLHISPQVWGNPDGIRCAKETMPLLNWRGPIWLGTDWDMFKVASNVTGAAAPRVPITFVDITTMSERRKDGHTSVHTIRQGQVLTPEQQADPGTYADCIHWCLPGVPDIWNSLLYTRIMSRPETGIATTR